MDKHLQPIYTQALAQVIQPIKYTALEKNEYLDKHKITEKNKVDLEENNTNIGEIDG